MIILLLDKIIQSIDEENLYRHVLNLEGIRHPIDDLDFLNDTADYILSEFDNYGLNTKEHIFQLEGIDFPFRNIEGSIGDGSEPELLITSHYDTVSISPGANDNASGVAGMLEIARVLANANYEKNIRFISFTLEEAHPKRELKIRKSMVDSGLVDDELRFNSYHTIKWLNMIDSLREEALTQGKTVKESWLYAKESVKTNLTKQEMSYIDSLIKLNSDITRTNWIGESICVGSTTWLKDQKNRKEKILGVLNLEEIGYISEKEFSQIYPVGINPFEHPSYNVNIDDKIGNFVCIFSDKYSRKLATAFCQQCKRDLINLPFHSLEVQLAFEEISRRVIDLLRSDHAPFWRENIPAISITDTFEFRYPFYHTSEDTIDYLDFDFMKKICQATIATIFNLI
ncbi:MAG: M28 family peptidase [Asgard group archaeon]|nr:M28 family peptidase [Asgard group archaeon]